MFVGYNCKIMLKKLAIIGILLSFAIPAMATDNQPVSQRTSGERQQNTQQSPAPTVTPMTNNQTTAYYQQDGKEKPQGWHKFIAWPDGITAWLIMLTLGAIVWQAWETRKAAEAARDSIRLQERAMQQWIEVTNWRSSMLRLTEGEGGMLTIDVDIVNRTPYPLTMGGTMYFSNSAVRKGYGETLTISNNTFLPPNSPHEAHVTVETTEGQVQQFSTDPVILTVVGVFRHTGVLNGHPQALGGTLACWEGMTRFVPGVNMKPIHPQEE
jgi:hypothetical protein